uniref:DUF4939 domain-containing protein n=1 Tax=Varanus komodoensis TaxID=61221 RepID=A0A8D2LL66_VARKO
MQEELLPSASKRLYTEATKLTLRRCPLETPLKYDGKKGFTTLKAQCELYINLRLPDFPNEKMKVGFLINQHMGAPAHWATARLIAQDPILNDANRFLNRKGVTWENDPTWAQKEKPL